MHYRNHSKVSGIITYLGVYRFGHQVSYNWSSGKWGDGHRKWSITWCLYQLLEGSGKFITYWGNWTSAICATRPFQIWVGGHWKNFYSKGYIDTGYLPVILSTDFVLYTLFGEVGVNNLLSSHFLYLSNDEANMLKGLLSKRAYL